MEERTLGLSGGFIIFKKKAHLNLLCVKVCCFSLFFTEAPSSKLLFGLDTVEVSTVAAPQPSGGRGVLWSCIMSW